MLQIIPKNIFNTDAKCLANPVNTQGVMGAGLALDFRLKHPKMFNHYKQQCQQNQVHIIYPLFADTLDMIMYKALQSKMKIISTIMGDNPSEEQISVGKEVIMHLRR